MRVHFQTALLAFGVSVLAPSRAAEPVPATGHGSVIEAFKSFLSQPPVVRALVFSERLPSDPKAPATAPLGVSQRFRYYEGLWQADAYFLREVPDLYSNCLPYTPGLLAARLRDECWFHYGRGYHGGIIEYSAERSHPMNHICQAAYQNSELLRQVLCMGLMHSEVGTVEWQGERFRVRASTDGYQTSGELTCSPTLPESLRVTYKNKSGDVSWIVRYAYPNRMAPNQLPETITCYWVSAVSEIARAEFHIYQLSTRDKPLAPDAFSPARFVTSNAWQVLVYSNDSFYAVLPDGGMRLIQSRGKAVGLGRRPGDPSAGRVFLVYTAWAGVNFWILALGMRASLRIKQKKQVSERKE